MQFKHLIEELDQEEKDLFEDMMEFILDLEDESLSEEMQDRYYKIIDDLDEYDEDKETDVTEAIVPKKKRIDPQERRKRRLAYRKNKSKIKRKQKQYRKTSAYKRYQKKSKRLSKRGLTGTGKRKSTIINKR